MLKITEDETHVKKMQRKEKMKSEISKQTNKHKPCPHHRPAGLSGRS